MHFILRVLQKLMLPVWGQIALFDLLVSRVLRLALYPRHPVFFLFFFCFINES